MIFYIITEKNEPVWFCLKVCPLYCAHRRHDEDASSLIYWDEDYGSIVHEEPEVYLPYHYFCKPSKSRPTTTTPPTTTTIATTTEEPTWICMVCMKKCGSLKNK
ncbi:unnamed protein product [Parnassius apollo]|uniref:(apollo) hypothetical protein n=1 Tax=Parnassius apollo TaxID=110799 RepID=A0A8S3XNF6_PARAO|nr:unnamed protein product [Parnassius apollo]